MDRFLVNKGKGKGKGVKRKRDTANGASGASTLFNHSHEQAQTYPNAKPAPLKIVTWNANGLGNRLRYDKEKLASFL